ncbi:MAG: response regulator transcription factor [Candidatus Taylorbacteria bacterium]|nr:response regulator transcription factor [Candidatus Taylorbacteria bacterium]
MRILIIEDDENLLFSLSKGLSEESFMVDTATNGERGSYMARTNEYDLIILDRTLPKKSGVDVCKEIRKSEIGTPILVLSATIDTNSKIELLNMGADDYITKPFSFNELLARLFCILRRPGKLQETFFAVSDLKLDIRKQKVMRDRKMVYLTRKEYSLLELLVKNKGIVLSRGMIMEHVWNADSDPFSNTIEAHILNLRIKINGGNRKKLIHNVPGRGYKIDDI